MQQLFYNFVYILRPLELGTGSIKEAEDHKI